MQQKHELKEVERTCEEVQEKKSIAKNSLKDGDRSIRERKRTSAKRKTRDAIRKESYRGDVWREDTAQDMLGSMGDALIINRKAKGLQRRQRKFHGTIKRRQ